MNYQNIATLYRDLTRKWNALTPERQSSAEGLRLIAEMKRVSQQLTDLDNLMNRCTGASNYKYKLDTLIS